MAKRLKQWNYGGWKLGENNYDGSRYTIEKQEFTPYSRNAVPTGKGSVRKAAGASRFGGEVSHGFPVLNGIQFTTAAIDRLVVHSGTQAFYLSGSTWVAMSGLTLSSTEAASFCQALDGLYCSQKGLGGLYVTTNGTSWSLVTNGKALTELTFFNARIWGIDTAGDIWYSNAYTTTTSPSPSISLGNFATYDSALPTKNPGFIRLAPGSGVRPTSLQYDSSGSNEALYVYTLRHGYWTIRPVSTPLSDGSLAHQVFQSNGYFGSPAPFSIGRVGNDTWFYDGEMLNSLGEVALYQNIRVLPKFGKLRGYLRSINPSISSSPALGFRDNIVYFAYGTGSFNDKVIAYDTVLGAPGAEQDGFNCSFFLLYQDGNAKRLLYGSSDPSDSYVYEMGVGTDVAGSPVSFLFEPASTDCGSPGLVKRLAKARVFYTSVLGSLTYRVVFEETRDLTGSVQVGSSASATVGLGCQPLGSYPLGRDYVSGTSLATLSTNSYFEIDTEFEAFERVTVQLSNSVTGEQAQIDDIQYLYTEGSQFETLDGSSLLEGTPSYEGDDTLGTYS